jgi:arabinose-5-phosphate isomerase
MHHALVKDVMTAEVLQIMDSTRINALPAVNAENELVGALDMHDLLCTGVV